MNRQSSQGFSAPSTLAMLGIFFLAIVIRQCYLLEIANTPGYGLLAGDAEGYHLWAMKIAGGDWLGTDVFYQAPLYPYFLAVVYSIFGPSQHAVRVIQVVLGALSCTVLAKTGERLFSPAAGVVSGVLLAVYPPGIYFDGLIQKASLSGFLMCLLLYLLSRFSHHQQGRWLIGSGMCLAAMCLIRENALVFLIIIPAGLLLVHRRLQWQKLSLWTLLFFVGAAMLFAPVALRNRMVGGEWALTTSQFGSNFYIGNHAGANGLYDPLRGMRGNWKYERSDAHDLAEEAVNQGLSPNAVSLYWLNRALSDIRSDPMAWIGLMLRKWGLVWNAAEIMDTESIYMVMPISRTLKWLGGLLDFGTIAALGMLGLCLSWPERHRLWPFYFMLIGFAASVALFFVMARYRYPLVPLLLLFAGAGLTKLLRRLREKAYPLPVIGLTAALAVFAMAKADMVSTIEMRGKSLINLGTSLSKAGRIVEAVPYLRAGLDIVPDDASAHANLGVALLGTDDSVAVVHLRRAVFLAPDNAVLRYNLFIGLERLGRYAEAKKQIDEALRIAPEYAPAINKRKAFLRLHPRPLEPEQRFP